MGPRASLDVLEKLTLPVFQFRAVYFVAYSPTNFAIQAPHVGVISNVLCFVS